jgi:hypothetical protein
VVLGGRVVTPRLGGNTPVPPPRGEVPGRLPTVERMQEELWGWARTVATLHYDLLREELGGDVLGVWLVGSAILGDLTPTSDVDTITLTAHPVEPEEHAAIARVHDRVHAEFPGVRHDTTYLSLASLALPPPERLVTPFSVDGRLVVDQPCGEVHPVTWFTLPHAIPVAGGISPHEVRIHADPAAARAHARHNLQAYWGNLVTGVRNALRDRDPAEVLPDPEPVLWLVLGAPRLAAFVAGVQGHGPIPSKSEAGRWVVRQLPAFADLAARALRARGGHPQRFTVADARRATDLVLLLVNGHG